MIVDDLIRFSEKNLSPRIFVTRKYKSTKERILANLHWFLSLPFVLGLFFGIFQTWFLLFCLPFIVEIILYLRNSKYSSLLMSQRIRYENLADEHPIVRKKHKTYHRALFWLQKRKLKKEIRYYDKTILLEASRQRYNHEWTKRLFLIGAVGLIISTQLEKIFTLITENLVTTDSLKNILSDPHTQEPYPTTFFVAIGILVILYLFLTVFALFLPYRITLIYYEFIKSSPLKLLIVLLEELQIERKQPKKKK